MTNFNPLKTCVPEKVGALTSLGVTSGQYNCTPKKGGVKSGHFPSHFYYTTCYCEKIYYLRLNLDAGFFF